MKISGSLYTRNAASKGYPFEESVRSLLAVCDKVLVMDAKSEDGTLRTLLDLARRHKNLIVIPDMVRGEARFEEHTRLIRSQTKAPWHIMLQADEVLHEASHEALSRLTENNPKTISHTVRRVTLFDGLDTCVRDGAPHSPFRDFPLRLGSRLLRLEKGGREFLSETKKVHAPDIMIYHYGAHNQHVQNSRSDLKSFFFTGDGSVDYRILESKDTCGFQGYTKIARSDLTYLPLAHPEVMTDWIEKQKGK